MFKVYLRLAPSSLHWEQAARGTTNTSLHEAAKNGHTEVVKLLLAHDNINSNIRNRSGKTARQLAESNGYEETVKAFD